MKDIESLKRSFENDLKWYSGLNDLVFIAKAEVFEYVLDKLNELDEPEVLSQEFIDGKKLRIRNRIPFHMDVEYAVPEEDLQDLLVPKQELPVIPKFVAEVIVEHKELGYDVYDSIDLIIETNGGGLPSISNWVARNIDKYARAWLDDYTVEEERKYYVLNNEKYFLLGKDKGHGFIFSTGGNSKLGSMERTSATFELTEQEIKDYDERYVPFMVPVEEVDSE